jgi:ketosteroid isomerase-like protein
MGILWRWGLVAVLCCATFQPVFGAATESPDAVQIRKVLDDQLAAWNRGDLDAFMLGYWHSPKLTFFSGATRNQGFDAAKARYIKRYRQDGAPMGHLTFGDLSIETSGELAYVLGSWELDRSGEKLGGLFTLVFRRFPEGWRIIHDHTGARETSPASPPSPKH